MTPATVTLGLLLLAALGWSGEDARYPAVHALLAQHCVSCHGAEKQKAGLRLDSREAVLSGAKSGVVVQPGRPDESVLVRLTDAKADPHMPPKGQLAAAEVATLAAWVAGLAPPPITPKTSGRDHWAFRPLARPLPPTVADAGWVRTPVDAFVLARLEAAGLKPAPSAGKAALIRRASFDLIGLPPTPEEVQAFIADSSPGAFATVVDRLLASPHYGERWARHWLDLARFAESNGIGEDRDRPTAWRYRDYVVRSFNADKPYGRFIAEQLAGDEIAAQDADALIATGFCRHHPSVDEIRPADAEKYRLDELDDVISTTGTVFMGLTVGCARCHDHKIDPISQRDYYRLLAVFSTSVKKDVPVPVAGGDPLVAAGPADDQAAKSGKVARRAPADTIMAITDGGRAPKPCRILLRGDLRNPGPVVEPGVPEVLSGAGRFAAAKTIGATTGLRRGLAEWLASAQHPLTWRVWANRVWQYHFGRGVVDSSSNFGFGGDRPSHPELLDWLAVELARTGQIKPLHRLILLSNTWQQSTVLSPATATRDPDGALIARQLPRRVEAECLRDAMLTVAGTLNRTAGGPSIHPRIPTAVIAANRMSKWPEVAKEGPEHWRRSIYVFVKRTLALPMLELFDQPSPTNSCERRTVSSIPTQALLLLNGDFTNEQSGHFARRVQADVGSDPARQVERAWWLALGRAPTAAETTEARAFSTARGATGLADLCHVLFCTNEFAYTD